MYQKSKKNKYKPQKKRERFQQKQQRPRYDQNQKIQVVGFTEYISLSNSDLMYFGKLHNLSYSNFRFTIQKILLDLNILLSFKYDDFWKQLKQSQSLKHCLQSCLSNFPKKMYGKVKKNHNQRQELQIQQNQLFNTWTGLIHVVLMIYHRIVCQSKTNQKYIIYDQWLMDIPKMFYLIGVYSNSNQSIVRQIINTLFQTIPQYRQDFIDFLIIIEDVILDQLETNVSFQFKRIVTQTNSNFSDPLKSFTTNLVKSIFTILDTYNSFIFLYQYFPKDLAYHFASNKGVQLNLLEFYSRFIQNIDGRWQILKQIKQPVSNSIQKSRHKITQYFLKTMNVLYEALTNQDQKYFIKSLQTYLGICKLFLKSERQQDVKLKNLKSLLRIMIKYTGKRKIFFTTDKIKKHLSIQQNQDIEKCCKIQNQIQKKQLQQIQLFSNIQFKLQKIPSYSQWSFSFDNYHQFNQAVNDFQIPNFYDDQFIIGQTKESTYFQQEKKKQKQKQKKNYQKEYDDQPDFQETERKIYSLVLPFQQTFNNQYNQRYNRVGTKNYRDLTIKSSQKSNFQSRQDALEIKYSNQEHQNILDLLQQSQIIEKQSEQLQSLVSNMTQSNYKKQESNLTIAKMKYSIQDSDLTLKQENNQQKLQRSQKIKDTKSRFQKKKFKDQYEIKTLNTVVDTYNPMDLSIRQKKPKKKGYKKNK